MLLALAAAILVAALSGQGAGAGVGWCRFDPIVLIDGEIADIFVAAPFDAPLRVTGPTEITVTVPVGVSTTLVLSDLGFGKGEIVRFEESRKLRRTASGIEIKIAVYVPTADGGMPVLVEFAPRLLGILAPTSAEGVSNTWVVLKTTF